MFYELTFNMERIDEAIKNGTNTIYAETTNVDEIEYAEIKKGFFDNIILSDCIIQEWPNVEFYYSSKASNIESDFLLNIKRWPIIHKRVKDEFEKENIRGIKYYPVKLIDVVTKEINTNYYLMFVKNFIDAYDMNKSQYKYNEKYDFYNFLPHGIYLDSNICSQYDIFRCKKSVSVLYVSDKIKNLIDSNLWIGFEFYKQKMI